jgi:hypothetical protein
MELATEPHSTLVYAEGYALHTERGHRGHHAWCVDPTKKVADRTWPNPEKCHYFGIAFRVEFIIGQIRETEMYDSVITPGPIGTIMGTINPTLLGPEVAKLP